MKGQWGLIGGLIIILIISVFAVVNVDPVEVNYLFGQSEWPLVLVIIGSALMGGLIVGLVGIYRVFRLQQEVKRLSGKEPEPRAENVEASHKKNEKENPDKNNLTRSKKD
jgi:lipopolysaccharide assembly protein A